MDVDESPRCCNVRSWSIFICIFDIIILFGCMLANIIDYNDCPWCSIVDWIINAIFLCVTVKFYFAIINRNVAFMRIWLWVCVSWMILSTILTIIWMYSSKGELRILLLVDGEDIKLSKKTELNIALIIFYVVIVMAIKISLHYPAYQYFKYERTRAAIQNQEP